MINGFKFKNYLIYISEIVFMLYNTYEIIFIYDIIKI